MTTTQTITHADKNAPNVFHLHILTEFAPDMQCDSGCSDCCGPVMCTEQEYRAVVEHAAAMGVEPKRQGLTCPFYGDGRCQVYDARPLVCRLFGHVETMVCSRGYNRNISPLAEEQLMQRYAACGEPSRMLHEAVMSFDDVVRLILEDAE